jgi:hypothetical protein
MAAPKNNQFWKNRSEHGRELLFADHELLRTAAKEYFNWCDSHPWYKVEAVKSGDMAGELMKVPVARPYTLSGLCGYVGSSESWWRNFRKNKSLGEDFLTVIEWIEGVIDTQQLEGAAVGAFNANIIARKLGLSDKSELVGKGDTELFKDKTDDELKTLLKDLSSKLHDTEG